MHDIKNIGRKDGFWEVKKSILHQVVCCSSKQRLVPPGVGFHAFYKACFFPDWHKLHT